MGETTLDIGPGSANCTPAFGMVGVGVMVGVRVGRRVKVAPEMTVLVALGMAVSDGFGVDEGVDASGKPVGMSSVNVGVGEAGWVSDGWAACDGVAEVGCPICTVEAMNVGR